MEFLEFLVDGLKEDCNNVKGKKPYVEYQSANNRDDSVVALEAGNKFLLRNDSFIDNLFVGFSKSATTCPDPACNHTSIVFDPFLSLKMPIMSPTEIKESPFTVTVVQLASSKVPIERYPVSLSKLNVVSELIFTLAAEAMISAENCILVEVHKNKIYKFFENTDSLEDVGSSDILVLFEVEDISVVKPNSKKSLKEGDVVIVKAGFQSNSKKSVRLRQGVTGRISKIDEDGDALIRFDDIDSRQWVLASNFHHLQVDTYMESDETRTYLVDDYEYTFRELVDRLESEIDNYSAIRATWHDEMEPQWPCSEDEEEDALPQDCVVVLHFRRTIWKTHKRELFGMPLLFTTPIISMPCFVKAVRKELSLRFGPENMSGWKVYRAESADKDLVKTDAFLCDETEMTPEEFMSCEREYLTVEWEDGLPMNAGWMDEDDEDSEIEIETCFKWLMEREQLSEQNSVCCNGCKKHQRAFKQVWLWSMPPILVLQLKRFEYNGVQRQRLATPVKFPLEGLDLRLFCLSQRSSFPKGCCIRAGQRVRVHGLQGKQHFNGLEGTVTCLDTATVRFCVKFHEGSPQKDWKKFKPENLEPVPSGPPEGVYPPLYDLIALSLHMGLAAIGHYVAYARSSEDGVWRYFDDNEVTEVSPCDVQAERSTAYVLFYIRRDLRPPSWGLPAELIAC